MRSLRLAFIGGLLTYRGLFGWLSPWIYIPNLLVRPVIQILLFVQIGRAAGIENPQFFVIGNAIQFTAVPCLFGMVMTVADERSQKLLGITISSPAPRLPLFLGRALPVAVVGLLVSAFCIAASTVILNFSLPGKAIAPLLLVILVAAASCTGLGLVNAAIGLRHRAAIVVANILDLLLLLLSTADIPARALPHPLRVLSGYIPLTHAIAAGRQLAAGATLQAVAPEIGREVAAGAVYFIVGLITLKYLEFSSRRSGSLETA
jgi:ABC-2 type transport system permease protein